MALPVSQSGIDYADGGFVSGTGLYPLVGDLAELAARLGSINTFDRRGNVVWLDDFEGGVSGWHKVGAGTGNALDVSSKYARSGGYAARLTSGSEEGSSCRMERYFPYPVPGKIGFEISFTIDANTETIHIGFVGLDGTTYFWGAVRYYPDDDTLKYGNTGGTFTSFATGVDLLENDYYFHTAKLVIDVVTGKYVRFILDDAEYDLSEYDYYSDPLAETPYMFAGFQIFCEKDTNPVSYVDDAILTQNEPPN